MSDKYDPFISAKRQFEDLFSPYSPMTSSTPLKESPMEDSSASLKRSPSPSKTSSSSISFRRTASLRAPKKAQKALSYMPKYKPSIQRGISDEGPMSSNFMKPEEFDELPVKSHAVIPPDLVPKSPAPARLSASSPKVVKRAHNTSANRRDLCLDLKLPNDFQLSKTDSLAAFLKYENDMRCLSSDGDSLTNSPPKFTEKDLKDKSNSLNKQSLSRNSFADLLDAKIESNDKYEHANDNSIDDQLSSTKFSFYDKFRSDGHSAENANGESEVNGNGSENGVVGRLGDTDQSIESQLINSKDNLRISNLSKLLHDSVSSSSMESVETTRHVDLNDLNAGNAPSDKVADGDPKRNPKRQIQLRKNNLLFDDTDQNGNQIDHSDKMSMTNLNITNDSNTIPDNSMGTQSADGREKFISANNNALEAIFDDFDLEEFISTFNDNEQFPIFKHFKDLNGPRSDEKLSNNADGGSSDECSTSEEKFAPKVDITRDYFSNGSPHDRIERSLDDVTPDSPTNIPSAGDQISATTPDVVKTDSKIINDANEKNDRNRKYLEGNGKYNAVGESGMSQTERELLESVHELNMMCDSPIRLSAIDANDDRISVDSYRYNPDSAYGR